MSDALIFLLTALGVVTLIALFCIVKGVPLEAAVSFKEGLRFILGKSSKSPSPKLQDAKEKSTPAE